MTIQYHPELPCLIHKEGSIAEFVGEKGSF